MILTPPSLPQYIYNAVVWKANSHAGIQVRDIKHNDVETDETGHKSKTRYVPNSGIHYHSIADIPFSFSDAFWTGIYEVFIIIL